jgi:DNA-binding protein YbaB
MDGPGRDARQWLAAYQERLRDAEARATAAGRALAGVEATATSRDGAVTVTVNPAGALQRLVLNERTEQLTRVQLAAAVLATARQAHAEAAREAEAAVATVVDAAALQVLRAQLSGAP